MNEYIYLGKIVNTHGIKGELRIVSNFLEKNQVFVSGFNLYIGLEKKREVINSYRVHKNYDMVTFKGYHDINEVLKYKGLKVYVKRSDLNLEKDYVLDDLIGMHVIMNDKDFGVVEDIFDNNGNTLLQVLFEKSYYIPYNGKYIKDVDVVKKQIYVSEIEELIL